MSAHAVDTLTWTFAVPCNSSAGTTTPAGITLPTGTYAVSVAGACILDMGSHSIPVGNTPCAVPVVGNVPCTTPITNVNNVPFTLIATGGGEFVSVASGNPNAMNWGCTFAISIDGHCFAAQAGTYVRTVSGPMTVSYNDYPGFYGDNAGTLDVTVTWTPL